MAKLKKKGFAGPATAGELAEYNRGTTPQKMSPVPSGYTAGKFHAPPQGDPQDDPNYHAKPPTPVASTKPAAPAPAPSAPKMMIGPRGRGPVPPAPTPRVAMKSYRVMSVDQYAAMLKADQEPTAPQGKLKKIPRDKLNLAKLMRPVSDEEKIAEVSAGKKTEKALATGYGKVSGGGALKAPNREPRGRRAEAGRPIDLERAMSVMPSPSGPAKPPKLYLPGVHSPKSPVRPKAGLKKPVAKKSERPTVSAASSPRALDGGGATELSNSLRNVVHKSEGATTMGKTNFSDLFKSELGTPDDEPIVDCPHCDAPITKSDILKGGKGKKTELSGAKHGKSGAHVRDQNPEGGVTRGGDGRGQVKSSRGVAGAQKHDAVAGVQNGKGSKTRKSDEDAQQLDDAEDQPQDEQPVRKSQGPRMTIRGTDFVQYIENEGPGGDAAIAKSIAEGALGGTPPTQPMDLNNDLSRLLV